MLLEPQRAVYVSAPVGLSRAWALQASDSGPDRPLVMLFGQNGAHQASRRPPVGKDAGFGHGH